MNPIKSLLVVLFYSFTLVFAYSNDKVKFGVVTQEELNMKVYEQDSSASAVILYDLGRFDPDLFMFTRHVRVKILSKAGLSWGNWIMNTPSRSDFKVLVFNKTNEGVTKERVSASSIHREEVISGYYINKVFATNVKVGSVIDLKYSFNGLPYEWRFQDLIPVKHSELIVKDHDYIRFNQTYYGFEPIESLAPGHWRSLNMPAFEPEPYINSYTNYITKINFEVTRITYPGFLYREYATSWQKVSENLNESRGFGDIIRSMSYLNDKAKELKKSNLTDLQKISSAYQFVKDNIKWNGFNSLYATADYRANFLKNHSGNSAEVNFALIALLNKSGMKTYPVVLSTRSNGMIMPATPTLDKLNYVVCYVKQGDTEILLDATNEKLVPGILPKKCLNGQGWVIDENKGFWIDLNSNHKFKNSNYVQISMNEDGVFEAKINKSNHQYAYLDWANQFDKYDNKDSYRMHLMDQAEDLEITSYEVKNEINEKLNSTESILVDMTDLVDDLGDEYIINPNLLSSFSNNPLKKEKRNYPVDMSYPIEEGTTIVLQIPEGYEVNNQPDPINLTALNNDLTFTLLSQIQGSYLNINCKINIKRSIFNEEEYHVIKEFYSTISDKFNQPISLKRI